MTVRKGLLRLAGATCGWLAGSLFVVAWALSCARNKAEDFDIKWDEIFGDGVERDEERLAEVVQLEDLRPHILSKDCWCMPDVVDYGKWGRNDSDDAG